MLIKYKIHEVSKDFNISSKEIISLLQEKLGVEKKSQTSLEDTELDLIFEHLTATHEVKSFDEYFAAGERAREERAAARKAEKDRKLAEQMAILEQLKAAQAAENAKKNPPAEPKPEAKPEAKSAAKAEPKKEEKKTEPKKAEAKPEKKPEKKAEVKADKKAEKPADSKKPSEPIFIPPQPKKEKKGEAPNRGPVEIRKVDTRASNINIDKYNERYEHIAPANAMRGDNVQRKQKIKQKSQDYRRPQGAKRETEADKLRRLQLEKIKRLPSPSQSVMR